MMAKVRKTTTTKRNLNGGLKDKRLLIALIVLASVLAFLGFFMGVSKVFETTTYWVLNKNVPTRTLVTTDMLKPVTISAGAEPKNALTPDDVMGNSVYTKYALAENDVLTSSNAGPYEDISVGVPDNWVVTSFGVNADDAVGGRITRGTYFDIMVAKTDGAFYPFVNVLALDTTVSLNTATSSDAANTSEAHAGQTSQYVVALTPQDAAKLQQLMEQYGTNVKLLLSPMQNGYNAPQLAAYSGVFKYDGTTKDLGKGTDGGFTSVERDQCGRPITDPAFDKTRTKACSNNGNVKSVATPEASSSTTTGASTNR